VLFTTVPQTVSSGFAYNFFSSDSSDTSSPPITLYTPVYFTYSFLYAGDARFTHIHASPPHIH
jgi:hypothetical protein